MNDLSVTSGNTNLRAVFKNIAKLPEKEVKEAENFMTAIKGGKADQAAVVTGQKTLQTLEEKTEVYMFHAAVLAGQESKSEKEIDEKIKKIDDSVATVIKVTDRLRKIINPAA